MNATRVYYIRIRGRVIGPKELPDMQRLAKRAQLNSRTPVSADGLSWLTAGDFPEIFTSAAAAAPPEQQQPADEATAVAAVAEEWHFAVNGQQHPNPVSLATLQSYVQAGTLSGGDLVYRAGWDNWRPVSSVPELSGGIRPIAAAPIQTGHSSAAAPHPDEIAAFASKKIAAGICGILLGTLGIHKFILGLTSGGLTMLLLSLLCAIPAPFMWLIGIIEGIIYLTKSDEDFYQTYAVQKKNWF